MLPVIPYWIDWSAPWGVYATALLLGSRPERLTALASALSLLCSIFVFRHGAGGAPVVELAQHGALFAVTTSLALAYDRWWLLVAAAALLLSMGTDVAAMLVPLHWWAAGTALWTWGWIFLASLTAGAWTSWRGRRAARAPQVRQTT